MRPWLRPVAAIVGVTLLVELAMIVSGMGPELLLVAALGGVIGVGAWLLGGLAEAAPTTSTIDIGSRPAPAARADRRTMRLRAGLAFGRTDGPTLQRLHENLVAIIDDQLRVAHDIDRRTDPAEARAALGDELQTFVDDPDAPAQLARPRTLDRVLTLIEQL